MPLPLFNPAPSSPPPSSIPLPPPQRTMSPTPLSSNTVYVALQYISPPSQLDRPLPPYLLSKPLLQRHHFLSLAPEDPVDYLCWPANTAATAIDLLESHVPSSDDTPPSYPIHYTADVESTYAHVALPAGPSGEAARLVFQWDIEGWKFHDTRLMPFPAGSSASLRDVLAASAQPAPSAPSASSYNPYGFNTEDDNSDDDDYWNAYGAADSESPRTGLQFVKEEVTDSEDAYWARYSSVQGTADSTIPSPPTVRRKAPPVVDIHLDSDAPLPVPVRFDSDTAGDALHIADKRLLHSHHNPRWDPASPHVLARLLADISPRQSPLHSSTLATEYVDELELSPPLDSSDDSDTLSPPDVSDMLNGEPFEADSVLSIANVSTDKQSSPPDNDGLLGSEPLKQSIRGLFTLWKMSRPHIGITSDAQDKESFMRLVGDAIAL